MGWLLLRSNLQKTIPEFLILPPPQVGTEKPFHSNWVPTGFQLNPEILLMGFWDLNFRWRLNFRLLIFVLFDFHYVLWVLTSSLRLLSDVLCPTRTIYKLYIKTFTFTLQLHIIPSRVERQYLRWHIIRHAGPTHFEELQKPSLKLPFDYPYNKEVITKNILDLLMENIQLLKSEVSFEEGKELHIHLSKLVIKRIS